MLTRHVCMRCGPAHALPCCHDENRGLGDNRITELPAQIFDKNIELEGLYVPAWAARALLVERGSAAPLLPFKRARLRFIANGKATRVHRGNPLRVCIPWVRPKTSCQSIHRTPSCRAGHRGDGACLPGACAPALWCGTRSALLP